MVMGCGGDDKPHPEPPPGTDGNGDGDGSHDGDCSTVAFSKPLPGAKLTTADDLDGNCENGVQYDVEVATSMPDGSEAVLSGGESQMSATVSGGRIRFPGVSFPIGETKLTVQVGDSPSCTAAATVSASCEDAPECVISSPTISPTHPKLGLADSVASPGNPFQAEIEVTTNIEDGRLVPLQVGGKPVANAIVVNGKATWPAVTLSPDGQHSVKATCTNRAGASSSDTKTFTVDTVAPDLTVSGVQDGQHFGLLDSADPNSSDVIIRVCGKTNANDALDLKQGPPPNPNNFCVGIGTASPECAQAKASTDRGACIDITCPGSAPFDIVATLYDEAGNSTKKTIQGVSCASNAHSVQIVEPVDGTGPDAATHILAANADQPRRDEDPSKPGAQYTVVACTDAENGKGTLQLGLADGSLSAWNSTPIDAEAAQPSDNCPLGLGYVMRFAAADLPDSQMDAAGELEVATRLVVSVESDGLPGKSPAVDVWVDSIAPTLRPSSPDPLCGAFHDSQTAWTTNVELASSTDNVSFAVEASGVSKAYTAASYADNKLVFEDVVFEPGLNEITATARKPSGNTSSLESPCAVTVGNPPVITWQSPAPGQNLCASGNSSASCVADSDASAPGWQGTFRVLVEVDGSPAAEGTEVKFTWGSEEHSATTDANGIAELPSLSIDDDEGMGRDLSIVASATVDGFGTGKATVSPIVDAQAPAQPADFAASVKDRRQTSFRLGWTASHDGKTDNPAHSYEVRVARSSIDAASFDGAEAIAYSGAPSAPGDADGIDILDKLIETDYYFGVAAVDRVGNRSEIAGTSEALRAKFNIQIIESPDPAGQKSFGYFTDGSGDLNHDGLSDLLVSPDDGNKVFAYFGTTNPSDSATPSITFEGEEGFGASVIYAGDIDRDGREDIAIGSFDNKVYIFKGRDSWPATLHADDADYVIEAGSEYAGSGLGFQLARLGDFDGDGIDDFAISAQFHDDDRGQVIIVRGSESLPAKISLPADIGTHAIVLEGDPALAGEFGSNLLGLGKFYGGAGNGIVVSAPSAEGGAGRVYAFRGGQSGTHGIIMATEANHTFDGLDANTQAGLSLGVVGPIGGSFQVVIGNPNYVNSGASVFGDAYVTSGNAATGPFSSEASTLTCSAASSNRDGFGNVSLGGGLSGRTIYLSLIGDSAPDLIVAGAREANAAARLYLFDGNRLSSLPASVDVVDAADIVVPLPDDWKGTSPFNTLLRDVNGDGYPDFAIGDHRGDIAGRVAIFW